MTWLPYSAVRETHTGVVIFLGDRVYKLKKPVRFPFADYSTIDLRRDACANEVALNRRLSPDVYLGVGSLSGPAGGEADAEPVVVMRRLPETARLSSLVTRGEPVEDEVRKLAHVIAAFHSAAAVTPAARSAAGAAATRRRWDDNAAEMGPFIGRYVEARLAERVIELARRYVDGRHVLFDERVNRGCARDGHGDLLADDIFLMPDGPRVLDCLEFDEKLRAGDVLADVAFLAMDLECLGRGDLGWRLLQWHRELLNDHWPDSLAHHQIAYRAQVRAKVSCLRAAQGDERAALAASELMALAERHLRAGMVRLVVVGGLPGTGKSTLARGLGDALGAVVLRSDEIRKHLAGLGAHEHAPAAVDSGIYDHDHTARTYRAMLDDAGALLQRGETVVLDASWLDPGWRDQAARVAAANVAALTELRCVAPRELALARIEARAAVGDDVSDADRAVAQAMAARDGPWPASTEVDTRGTPAASLHLALDALDAAVA